MPDLFGLDIAGIIADSIDAAGGVLDATLRKRTAGTRTTGSLTKGTNGSEQPLRCKGFYDQRQFSRLPESLSKKGTNVAVLLGATIPGGQIPEPGDSIFMAAEDAKPNIVVMIVDRDPAAATYSCLVRST